MRPTPWLLAEPHRLQVPGYESAYGDNYGMFLIPHARTGVKLRVMAQSGSNSRADLGHAYAWDHVSVSLPNRTPNWVWLQRYDVETKGGQFRALCRRHPATQVLRFSDGASVVLSGQAAAL